MSYTLTTWLPDSEPESQPLSASATETTVCRLAEAYQKDGYHVEVWQEKAGKPELVVSLKPDQSC